MCSARLLGVPELAKNCKSWRVGAHRAFYAVYVGPIPDGMEVRHLCNNPPCVNPEHLALGTHAENMLDIRAAYDPQSRESLPRFCRNGHDYADPENVKMERYGRGDGWRRRCVPCAREASRKYEKERRSRG